MHRKNVSSLFLLFFLTFTSLNATGLRPTPSGIKTASFQEAESIYYDSGMLYFKGLQGNAKVQVFSVIANKLLDLDVLDLSDAELPINLQSNNVYIVRVVFSNSAEIKTFKIIAQ